MPRKGSPYGPAHERARARILTPGTLCRCGAPATELDHVPPLSTHAHVNGSGCCHYEPACRQCQAEQGFALGWGKRSPTAELELVEPDDSPGPSSSVWDVPWLDGLRDVPADATWPRYMTAPHPAAVGSYGVDAIPWLRDVAEIDLRWFQRLALVRQLEHDDEGLLVWLTVLGTTARQVGKSIWLRGGATWRLHQAELFGEQQLIMHTGKDLPVCKEVQRPSRAWARARGYVVREQNGSEEIGEPMSGSRWLVRGKGSVYGYSVSNGLCDEAWGVEPSVVEDGLEPTMAERVAPQLVLASTAHSRATSLFPASRAAALAELEAPAETLLVEWSARRDAAIDDRAAWRQASPHWSKGRQRLLEQRLAKVTAGELLDDDEADPVESFRSQYLNIWPAKGSSDPGAVLLDVDVWAQRAELVDSAGARVFVAVADNYGHGAAVAAAARLADGRYELDGWLVDSWAEAFADVAGLYATRARTQLVIGPALASDVDQRYRARVATPTETRAGLALLRQLVATGAVVHDQAPELEQLTTVHVKELSSGLSIVAGSRSDLCQAAAWALLAAHQSAPEPAIR
jgi:hypothetical protein